MSVILVRYNEEKDWAWVKDRLSSLKKALDGRKENSWLTIKNYIFKKSFVVIGSQVTQPIDFRYKQKSA